MRCYARLSVIAVLGLLCACGGGGSSGTTTTIPQANPAGTGNGPASNSRSVQLGLQPTLAELPVVSQIAGTLLFPAVRTSATVTLSASATAPVGVAPQSERRAESGTLTVYEYFTIVPATSVTLPNIPAVTLHFPSSTTLAGKSMFYGISDLNAQGGLVSFDTEGPGAISGQSVSFAQVPTPITFVAGHKYTFVVYATAITATVGATQIYVTNEAPGVEYPSNTVTTYDADGTQTLPVISLRTSPGVTGVAIDAAGKIYVANGLVRAYNADGTQTTSTISNGFNGARGVAIGASGKIYVSWDNNTVTTYNTQGTQMPPTISNGLNGPWGVAVDAAGKIYVANEAALGPHDGSVTTYNADGTRTTPTITGLNSPTGVAVNAAGKIYVAHEGNNTVTTYNAQGTQTPPTISNGLNQPYGVAVDAAGKIYVANTNNSTVTTYNADGSRSLPTITAGLLGPDSVAVH